MPYLRSYVDPGSGFIFGQGLLSVAWAMAFGLFGFFLLFFKFLFRSPRRILFILIIAVLIFVSGGLLMHKDNLKKKVIIIGIDAMDAGITEKLIHEGRLPALAYLKTIGSYSRLATTNPSESAVAWTSFATGLNPGGHGIFDFVMRDPANYQLYLSLNEIDNSGGRVRIKSRRKGKAFWEILTEHKIPSFIYFCPNTFPPQPLTGRMISGMGVPDITGTMGTYSFYTTKGLSGGEKDMRGKVIPVVLKNGVINTCIYGPRISSADKAAGESSVPLKITLPPGGKEAVLEFQGNKIMLKEKSWSDWAPVAFNIGVFKKAHGIVRYRLNSVHPDLELYMSPVNFDPRQPPFPISYPKSYSAKLAASIGLFYTQGMPYDTWALTEGRLDEQAFLELVDEILEEKQRILQEALGDFKKGAFFYYFETLDALQHMFWRYLDRGHPLYKKDPRYQEIIYRYYEKIDKIIGGLLKTLDKEATLIVLSDHGFNSFRKAVNLNRWLLENGYLVLKKGHGEGGEFFEDLDWSRTKAYSLGFGGIYLNKIGREYYGIVSESEAKALEDEIAKGLEAAGDPGTGEKFVNKVYLGEEIFSGAYRNDGPDLFAGFSAGYRASWKTALGGVPKELIENNDKKWSGDHLVDPALVPGVILLNKKVGLHSPSIIDLAPAILKEFDLPLPKEMPGDPLFNNKDQQIIGSHDRR